MSLSTLSQTLRHALRDTRNRSIAVFFVTSISGRGIGILCQLVQVPLALRYLGKEAFGVWVTLASISYLISFSDLGIGMGAQNQITEALGVGDRGSARKLFLTTLVFLCAVALVLTVVGVPTFLHLNWGALFKLHDQTLIRAMPRAMTAFLLMACVNVPLGIGRRLVYATQQAWLDNVAGTVTSAIGLAGAFLGAYLHLGFLGYVVITSFAGTAIGFAFLLYVFASFDWLHGSGAWFDRSAMRGLLNLGLLFGVQQICSLVVFGSPPILISTLLGAAAITPFNLATRIFNVFQMFQNAFLLPLWPAYADAKSKGDLAWMSRTLRRSLLLTVGVALVPMIGISFVIRPIIHLWTGTSSTLPTAGLVAALLLWNLAVALQQPLGFFLAGVSEVKRNTLYSILTTISTGVLMPLLARPFGINGIILGLVIGTSLFSLPGSAYEVWRYLRLAKAKASDAGSPASPGQLATIESGQ